MRSGTQGQGQVIHRHGNMSDLHVYYMINVWTKYDAPTTNVGCMATEKLT